MRKNTQTAKGMLVIGTLLLAGCASAPTLDFPIPKDKIAAFNECMVPVSLRNQNKDDEKFWLNGLRKFVPRDLHESDLITSLTESLPEILNMLYADKDKLTVHRGEQLLSVSFDMHEHPFPYIDSRMVDVVEKIFDSVNLSLLLQPENRAQADSNRAETTIPERIAKALKAYLLAYFTASPNTNEKTGFISRDGTTFQFPVEIDSISGNKIQTISSVDHSQVGADIIRITLEAIRDGSLDECDALPAIDNSATGVKNGLLRIFTDKPDMKCTKRTWKIASEKLSVMQARANAAESMIATAAGKALRGGSIGSLDNEALARAAETAIGVMARHTTERVEWCRASLE